MSEKTKLITISLDSVEGDVMKVVSAIAKRQTDKAERTLFSNVTLSTAEKAILNQYIKAAASVFAGEVAPIVKTYIDASLPLSVTFNVTRLNDGHKSAFESNFRSFVNAYVTNMILMLSNTEQAKSFAEDMATHLNAAIKLVYDKDPPSTSVKSLKDMTGSIEIDPQITTTK